MQQIHPSSTASRRARTLSAGTVVALMVALAAGTAHADDAKLIREHVLDQLSVSTKKLDRSELNSLATRPVYEVAVDQYSGGESVMFMAVDDGDVLRIYRHGHSKTKDNFLRLLPDDFRVTDDADAKRLVAAAMAVHTRFGEPDMSIDEMRLVTSDGQYVFVDGERFGDATGYLVEVDSDGQVTAFEYSNELPVNAKPDDS